MKTIFFKWLLILPILLILSSCDKKMATKRISLSPNPLVLTSDAQTKIVRVENVTGIQPSNETDIELNESTHIKNDWIEIKFNGPRNIDVTVQENTSPNSRTYDLWVDSYISSDFLHITQNGKTS